LWKILKHFFASLEGCLKILEVFQHFKFIVSRFMTIFNDVQRNLVEKHCCKLLCLNKLTPLWFISYWANGAAFLTVRTNDISRNFRAIINAIIRAIPNFETFAIIYLSSWHLIADTWFPIGTATRNSDLQVFYNFGRQQEKTDNLVLEGTELKFVECEAEIFNAESL
jgi:hypothetical protein